MREQSSTILVPSGDISPIKPFSSTVGDVPQVEVEVGVQPVGAEGPSNERIVVGIDLSQGVEGQGSAAPNIPGEILLT